MQDNKIECHDGEFIGSEIEGFINQKIEERKG
jgi:hypothetical protein